MNKDFKQEYKQCPHCGSEERFFEQLGQELKDTGLARPEWNAAYSNQSGFIMDKTRVVILPVGISIPGFHIATDVCMKCGTIYATKLQRLEGQTELKPLNPNQPRFGNS